MNATSVCVHSKLRGRSQTRLGNVTIRLFVSGVVHTMWATGAPTYCNKFAGSISQWKFITLRVQYTTLDYSSQLV
jgi:hypothetical protein